MVMGQAIFTSEGRAVFHTGSNSFLNFLDQLVVAFECPWPGTPRDTVVDLACSNVQIPGDPRFTRWARREAWRWRHLLSCSEGATAPATGISWFVLRAAPTPQWGVLGIEC